LNEQRQKEPVDARLQRRRFLEPHVDSPQHSRLVHPRWELLHVIQLILAGAFPALMSLNARSAGVCVKRR
jgi:hypothetical protein